MFSGGAELDARGATEWLGGSGSSACSSADGTGRVVARAHDGAGGHSHSTLATVDQLCGLRTSSVPLWLTSSGPCSYIRPSSELQPGPPFNQSMRGEFTGSVSASTKT